MIKDNILKSFDHNLIYFHKVNLMQIFLIILLIIKKGDGKRKKYILVFLLTISIALTHLPELFILAGFLLFYELFIRKNKFNMNGIYNSTFLSILFLIPFYFFIDLNVKQDFFNIEFLGLILIICGELFFLILVNKLKIYYNKHSIRKIKQRTFNKKFSKKTLKIVIILYLASLISSFFLIRDFHTSSVIDSGIFPWFLIPNSLGFYGICGIFAIYYFFYRFKQRKLIIKQNLITLSLGISSYLLGLFFSVFYVLFNVSLYLERRMMTFIQFSMVLIAVIGLFYFFQYLKNIIYKLKSGKFLKILLLSLIIFSTYSTTFLYIDLWLHDLNNSTYYIPPEEQNALNTLESFFNKDPNAWVITVSDKSWAFSECIGASDILVNRKNLYSTNSLEIGLNILYRSDTLSHPYIYLANRDRIILGNNKYDSLFFNQYLKLLPIVYNKSDIEIYNSSKLSPPSMESKVALILPYENILNYDQKILEYYLLSSNFIDYSVILDQENSLRDYQTLILGYDPPSSGIVNQKREFFENFTDFKNWEIIDGNWVVKNNTLLTNNDYYDNYGEIELINNPFDNYIYDFNFSIDINSLNSGFDNLSYFYLKDVDEDGTSINIFKLLFNSFNHKIYFLYNDELGWPGINTGITWNNNQSYLFKLSSHNNKAEVYINNTKVYTLKDIVFYKNIRLGYERLYELKLGSLSFEGLNFNFYRNVTEYFDFVEQGGTLIILNPNGYNYFGNMFLNNENMSISALSVEGRDYSYNLTHHIDIPVYKTNYESILNYSDGNSENFSNFVSKRDYFSGKIYYINAFPIYNSYNLSRRIYPEINDLIFFLDFYNLTRFNENNWNNLLLSSCSTNIDLYNGSIFTDTIIYPKGNILDKITFYFNSSEEQYTGVEFIYFGQNNGISINCDHFFIKNGFSFYSNAVFNDSIEITLLDKSDLTILVNGTQKQIKNVEKIYIPFSPKSYNNELLSFLVRSPVISSKFGNIKALNINGVSEENNIVNNLNMKIAFADQNYIYINYINIGSYIETEGLNNNIFILFNGLYIGLQSTVLVLMVYIFYINLKKIKKIIYSSKLRS